MKECVKYFVLVLLISLFSNCFVAQAQSKNYVDSLLRIANKPKRDSNSVNAYIQLQRYFFEHGRFDSTLKYARKALPIAKAVGTNKNLARMLYRMGMTYTNLQTYDSAKFYLDQAVTSAVALRDTLLEVTCYDAFAILSSYQSDYATSIEYSLRAVAKIDKSRSVQLKNVLPQTYSRIAYNFVNEKQYAKAIEYGKKGLLIKGYPSEGRHRVMLYLNVFYAYLEEGELKVGKTYLDSAVTTNRSLDNAAIAAIVANNEGLYYQRINDYEKASIAYLNAYQLNKSGGYQLMQSEAGDNLANIYYKMKQYKEAEKYALESNAMGKQLKLFQVIASTYNVLKNLSTQKGDFKNALAYAEQNKVYADSALNQETQKVTLSLESKYQNQKKEREIAVLTIANSQNELQVVRRNRLLMAGGIAASSALIILGLFYRNSRQKNLIAEQEKKYQQEQIKFLERQQQVVSLQSMVNGQETERTRIAKDLHDGLGGLFSTVKMYFSTLQHDTPTLKDNELFQKSYKLVDTASEEVRQIAHNMMPEVLMKLGLANALKDLCDNISAGKLLKVSLETHGMNKRLNATTEIMLFRIVQELLNNIIKHANATEAIIQFIRESERLSVIVEDNGRGFNTQEADEQNHSGIATIQSRVSYLNGKMSIDSQKNVGTTVMMDFLINEGD
jgi:two-component system, NarL family, sensor kinase